jgi:hypothetical protein
MMNKQPILDELHAVHEQLLNESGETLSGLFASLLEEQSRSTRMILKTLHIPGSEPHEGDPVRTPVAGVEMKNGA